MSRFASFAIVVAVLAAPFAAAQDPVPVGYTSYLYQPAWGVPVVPASMMPPMPYPYPVQPMSMHAPHVGHAPAAPVEPTAPVTGQCPSGHCAKFVLFDGSHLANFFAKFHRQPRGPVVIDNLPTHPYARSPRDFFMFYENLEAERSRDLRPTLIP